MADTAHTPMGPYRGGRGGGRGGFGSGGGGRGGFGSGGRGGGGGGGGFNRDSGGGRGRGGGRGGFDRGSGDRNSGGGFNGFNRDSRGGGGGGRGGGGGGFRGRDSGGFRGGRGGTPRGGRGGGRGGFGAKPGRNQGSFKGGKKVLVEPHHRFPGVFIARGKEDAIVTKNMVPGESVYGEKRISHEENGEKVEYRAWNPYRSKLGAAILSGVENCHITPGCKVLYLGAASGTSVSHVSDLIGPEGRVYAVEFSQRSGRDLLGVAQKRSNIIPIIDDARHPAKYRMMLSMVDTIFSDVAQPDQARIVALNASHYLKIGGHIVMSIKANCVDSTAAPEVVFASEVKKLQSERIKPLEQISLEPYEKDHAVVTGQYRADDLVK